MQVAFLNAQFVVLLSHLGVPDSVLEQRTDAHLELLRTAPHKPLSALRLLLMHGEVAAATQLLCGGSEEQLRGVQGVIRGLVRRRHYGLDTRRSSRQQAAATIPVDGSGVSESDAGSGDDDDGEEDEEEDQGNATATATSAAGSQIIKPRVRLAIEDARLVYGVPDFSTQLQAGQCFFQTYIAGVKTVITGQVSTTQLNARTGPGLPDAVQWHPAHSCSLLRSSTIVAK